MSQDEVRGEMCGFSSGILSFVLQYNSLSHVMLYWWKYYLGFQQHWGQPLVCLCLGAQWWICFNFHSFVPVVHITSTIRLIDGNIHFLFILGKIIKPQEQFLCWRNGFSYWCYSEKPLPISESHSAHGRSHTHSVWEECNVCARLVTMSQR